MATSKLNLTRDQLATFLKDHEAIKQFERLFAVADSVAPDSDTPGISVQAGNAQAAAEQAISMVLALADAVLSSCAAIDAKASQSIGQVAKIDEETAISIASADNKANQALQLIAQLSQAVNDLAASNNQSGQALAALAKLAADVEGLQMIPPRREFQRARHGAFYDTTTQTAAVINTGYPITFNTTDIADGIYRGTTTSQIHVDTAAIYNIQFSAQFDNTSGGNHLAYLWLRKNGVDVAQSNSQLRMKGTDGELVAAWNFFIKLAAGDYIELVWAVSDTAVQLVAQTASAFAPAIPSCIITISNNLEGVK